MPRRKRNNNTNSLNNLEKERVRRKNGLSAPYTSPQISTWIALPLLVIEFLVFVSPILPIAITIPCTFVYLLSVFVTLYYAIKASSVDPMDHHLAKHLKKQAGNGEEKEAEEGFASALAGDNGSSEVETLKHCWICDTQVNSDSMHCKFCNKCVGEFDHHCMWLNTCIGKANYPYFLRTMVYITIMLLVHASIHIVLIVDIFLQGESKEFVSTNWLIKSDSIWITFIVVYIVFAAFDFISLSLVGQLLHFHMGLRKEGLTTYKYIIRETQRKREKIQLMSTQNNQRIVAIAKANDENNSLLARRLKIGKFCSESMNCQMLDPLPSPVKDSNNANA